MKEFRVSFLIEFYIEAEDEEEARIKAHEFNWNDANDADIINIEEI